jgi:hypothetical protein
MLRFQNIPQCTFATIYNTCGVNLHINNKKRNIDTSTLKKPHCNSNVEFKKVVPPKISIFGYKFYDLFKVDTRDAIP